MSASKILFRLAFFFLAGIAVASFWSFSWLFVLSAGLAGLFLFVVDRRSLLAVGLIGLCLGIGYLNYQVGQRLALQELWSAEEEVVFLATVVGLPEVRSSGVRLSLKVEWPISARSAELSGRVGVFGPHGLADHHPGQQLIVAGRVVSNDEEFRGHNLKEGNYAFFFHPLIRPAGFNWRYAGSYLLSRVRQGSARTVDRGLAEPQSSLLKAMLVGERPSEQFSLPDQLRRTGLSHIAVVSGMHLVILVQLVFSLAKYLKAPASFSALMALLVVVFFILLTGGRPSVLRAGLMAGFGLIGALFGRINHPGRGLVWAAVFLLLGNPLLLRWDIGFQLSFGAAWGLIHFSPWLKRWLFWLPGKITRELLSVSLAAQLMTAPLIAYYFQQVSLISPLANFLVVAFLPLVFALGLLFLFSGGFALIGLALGLVLFIMTGAVALLAGIGWAAVPVTVPLWFLAIYYLFWLIVGLNLKKRDRPAFHALGLC